MFCLYQNGIEIGIRQSYTKFNFFGIRQVFIGLEFRACEVDGDNIIIV